MNIDIKIVKIGNSLAFRIPKLVATQLHLEAGTHAALTYTNSKITIQPQKKSYTLASLLTQITPQNCHQESFNDAPIGAEIG